MRYKWLSTYPPFLLEDRHPPVFFKTMTTPLPPTKYLTAGMRPTTSVSSAKSRLLSDQEAAKEMQQCFVTASTSSGLMLAVLVSTTTNMRQWADQFNTERKMVDIAESSVSPDREGRSAISLSQCSAGTTGSCQSPAVRRRLPSRPMSRRDGSIHSKTTSHSGGTAIVTAQPGTTAGRDGDNHCPICCLDVRAPSPDSVEDEGLFCEGKCNAWFHRHCAGITKKRYAALSANPDTPFLCHDCLSLKRGNEVANLRENVSALTGELEHLKATVSSLLGQLQTTKAQVCEAATTVSIQQA